MILSFKHCNVGEDFDTSGDNLLDQGDTSPNEPTNNLYADPGSRFKKAPLIMTVSELALVRRNWILPAAFTVPDSPFHKSIHAWNSMVVDDEVVDFVEEEGEDEGAFVLDFVEVDLGVERVDDPDDGDVLAEVEDLDVGALVFVFAFVFTFIFGVVVLAPAVFVVARGVVDARGTVEEAEEGVAGKAFTFAVFLFVLVFGLTVFAVLTDDPAAVFGVNPARVFALPVLVVCAPTIAAFNPNIANNNKSSRRVRGRVIFGYYL